MFLHEVSKAFCNMVKQLRKTTNQEWRQVRFVDWSRIDQNSKYQNIPFNMQIGYVLHNTLQIINIFSYLLCYWRFIYNPKYICTTFVRKQIFCLENEELVMCTRVPLPWMISSGVSYIWLSICTVCFFSCDTFTRSIRKLEPPKSKAIKSPFSVRE